MTTRALADDVVFTDDVWVWVCDKKSLSLTTGVAVGETLGDPLSDWLDRLGLTEADLLEETDTLWLRLVVAFRDAATDERRVTQNKWETALLKVRSDWLAIV